MRISALKLVAALIFLAVATAYTGRTAQAAPVLVEKSAAADFATVTARIRTALKAKKMAIVRQIHFQDMLVVAGIKSEPAITFETFHPRFGKMLYLNDKAAFIEVPLRIHVRETDDGVVVRYRTPSSIFADYKGLAETGAQLDAIFADVVAEAIR